MRCENRIKYCWETVSFLLICMTITPEDQSSQVPSLSCVDDEPRNVSSQLDCPLLSIAASLPMLTYTRVTVWTGLSWEQDRSTREIISNFRGIYINGINKPGLQFLSPSLTNTFFCEIFYFSLNLVSFYHG